MCICFCPVCAQRWEKFKNSRKYQFSEFEISSTVNDLCHTKDEQKHTDWNKFNFLGLKVYNLYDGP